MHDIGNMPIAAQPRGRTWPWAAGSVLAVALVLAATLIGRHIAASHRAAGYLVAAPTQPTLSVLGATPAARAIRLAALDPKSGDLLALTSSPLRDCPPAIACAASPVPDTLAVYDGTTGRQLAARALAPNDPLTHAALLLVDGTRGVAYAVVPTGEQTDPMLYRISPTTAEPVGEQVLSSVDVPTILGGALVPATGDLALVAGNDLLLLDPTNGMILKRQPLGGPAGMPDVDGPVVDGTSATIYLEAHDGPNASLRAFAAKTLQPTGQRQLPAAPAPDRLGDYDPARNVFAFVGAGGVVATLPAGDPSATPHTLSGVTGALAVAWDGANNRLVVARSNDVTVYDAQTGQLVATLPMPVETIDAAAPIGRGLFTAPEGGRVYMRDATGAFVIATDAKTTRGAANPGAALILARAAMAHFLPTSKQTPPFVAASSFPVGAGARPRDYFIDFSDRGWQAYPNGSIASAVSATTRDRAAYQVTFTVSWYQLFQHTHTWTCLVMADGSVRLSAESGDALP